MCRAISARVSALGVDPLEMVELTKVLTLPMRRESSDLGMPDALSIRDMASGVLMPLIVALLHNSCCVDVAILLLSGRRGGRGFSCVGPRPLFLGGI